MPKIYKSGLKKWGILSNKQQRTMRSSSQQSVYQQVETAAGTMEVNQDDILVVEVAMGYQPKPEEVKEGCLVMLRMMDRPRPALFDIRGIAHLDYECRCIGHSVLKDVKFTAVALVIHSPITRLISKMVFSFTRRPFPREVFYDRNDALHWLRLAHGTKQTA